jgi:hypothetical protein
VSGRCALRPAGARAVRVARPDTSGDIDAGPFESARRPSPMPMRTQDVEPALGRLR